MCISQHLYKATEDFSAFVSLCQPLTADQAQTDALASGGFIEAGYTGIHMDDWCLPAS